VEEGKKKVKRGQIKKKYFKNIKISVILYKEKTEKKTFLCRGWGSYQTLLPPLLL
jgi:hypothetical protein